MTKNLSYFILLLSTSFFLFIKIPHLSIRLSDTNVYFYTSYQILNSQVLYKDIFFTNLPLFPYIASFYYLLTSGNLFLFYATSFFEVIAITFLIYYIIYSKTKNYLLSGTCVFLFISSSTVLITSDHQTGVYTASIFALLSYLFLEKKNFPASGIFAGLTLLTKAYFLPVILSFIIYLLLIKEVKNLSKLLLGLIITVVVVLSPFLIFSQKEFVSDIFYSLARGGVAKIDVVAFFAQYDFMLFLLFIFSLINFKNNSLFSLISLSFIAFIIFYEGIFHIYLNIIIPFLAISFYNLSDFLTDKRPFLKIVLPIIVFIAIVANIIMYIKYFANHETIKDINSIVEVIKKENPRYLYGTPDITPAFAYLSKVDLLDNIIDTNPNIFRKKIFDSTNLTQKAIDSRIIIVARGTDKLIIDNSPINEIFDKGMVLKSCKPFLTIPIKTNSKSDRINLLKCY